MKKLIGLRTIKTLLGVFITMLIDKITDFFDLFIMATTCIISMQPTKVKTLEAGLDRILGTFIGGILSLILVYLRKYIPYYDEFLYLLIIPLFLLILILLCNKLNKSGTISISSIVFFRVITGVHTAGGSELLYVITRVTSSFIGVIIALIVNSHFNNHLKNKEKDKNTNQRVITKEDNITNTSNTIDDIAIIDED